MFHSKKVIVILIVIAIFFNGSYSEAEKRGTTSSVVTVLLVYKNGKKLLDDYNLAAEKFNEMLLDTGRFTLPKVHDDAFIRALEAKFRGATRANLKKMTKEFVREQSNKLLKGVKFVVRGQLDLNDEPDGTVHAKMGIEIVNVKNQSVLGSVNYDDSYRSLKKATDEVIKNAVSRALRQFDKSLPKSAEVAEDFKLVFMGTSKKLRKQVKKEFRAMGAQIRNFNLEDNEYTLYIHVDDPMEFADSYEDISNYETKTISLTDGFIIYELSK